MEIRSPQNPSEWEAYYDLRYRVLREPFNKPRGSERNEGDETAQHFALFEGGRILSVARLDTLPENICQVRFVAVETDQQSKGLGLKIMSAVEEAALQHGFEKIILHARDYAVTFYKKQDYILIGPSYKLFDVLQHYEMYKMLV
ncbi:MAG: GNAT family N-acetyltransferase [Fluviicola sp.]|jgi:predicted GNAT family N-acyltransferase